MSTSLGGGSGGGGGPGIPTRSLGWGGAVVAGAPGNGSAVVMGGPQTGTRTVIQPEGANKMNGVLRRLSLGGAGVRRVSPANTPRQPPTRLAPLSSSALVTLPSPPTFRRHQRGQRTLTTIVSVPCSDLLFLPPQPTLQMPPPTPQTPLPTPQAPAGSFFPPSVTAVPDLMPDRAAGQDIKPRGRKPSVGGRGKRSISPVSLELISSDSRARARNSSRLRADRSNVLGFVTDRREDAPGTPRRALLNEASAGQHSYVVIGSGCSRSRWSMLTLSGAAPHRVPQASVTLLSTHLFFSYVTRESHLRFHLSMFLIG